MKNYRPDPVVAAFMAIGMDSVMRAEAKARRSGYDYPDMDSFSGHVGFVGEAMRHVELVDRVGDYLDEAEGHLGVFVYEIVEDFGAKIAEKMLNSDETVSESEAIAMLRDTMTNAGYSQTVIDAAIAYSLRGKGGES